MTANDQKTKVAVVQAAPVLFNQDATIAKACDLIGQAAEQGAQLILFPEAFIPAYPRGLAFGTVVGSRSPVGRKIWQRYWENTVEVPGPATRKLGEAAKKEIAQRQKDGRLPADRNMRLRYSPNGSVFFTWSSGNIPAGFKKNTNKQQTPQDNKRGGGGGFGGGGGIGGGAGNGGGRGNYQRLSEEYLRPTQRVSARQTRRRRSRP